MKPCLPFCSVLFYSVLFHSIRDIKILIFSITCGPDLRAQFTLIVACISSVVSPASADKSPFRCASRNADSTPLAIGGNFLAWNSGTFFCFVERKTRQERTATHHYRSGAIAAIQHAEARKIISSAPSMFVPVIHVSQESYLRKSPAK